MKRVDLLSCELWRADFCYEVTVLQNKYLAIQDSTASFCMNVNKIIIAHYGNVVYVNTFT